MVSRQRRPTDQLRVDDSAIRVPLCLSNLICIRSMFSPGSLDILRTATDLPIGTVKAMWSYEHDSPDDVNAAIRTHKPFHDTAPSFVSFHPFDSAKQWTGSTKTTYQTNLSATRLGTHLLMSKVRLTTPVTQADCLCGCQSLTHTALPSNAALVHRWLHVFTQYGYGTRSVRGLNLVEISIVPNDEEPTRRAARVALEMTVTQGSFSSPTFNHRIL